MGTRPSYLMSKNSRKTFLYDTRMHKKGIRGSRQETNPSLVIGGWTGLNKFREVSEDYIFAEWESVKSALDLVGLILLQSQGNPESRCWADELQEIRILYSESGRFRDVVLPSDMRIRSKVPASERVREDVGRRILYL